MPQSIEQQRTSSNVNGPQPASAQPGVDQTLLQRGLYGEAIALHKATRGIFACAITVGLLLLLPSCQEARAASATEHAGEPIQLDHAGLRNAAAGVVNSAQQPPTNRSDSFIELLAPVAPQGVVVAQQQPSQKRNDVHSRVSDEIDSEREQWTLLAKHIAGLAISLLGGFLIGSMNCGGKRK